MLKRIRFTQQRIANLPEPEKGRVEYYDEEERRLTCRVSSVGTKTFVVLKKATDGTTKRISLGRYPDISVSHARKLAAETLLQISSGVDPNEGKRKQRHRSITLEALLEQYIADKTLRPKTVKDYREKVRTGFPDWLDMPVNKITRDMVKTRRRQITAGRDNKFRVLRLLMNYAHKTLAAIDQNPVDILTDGRLWDKPKRRTRLIPSDRLKDWHDAVLALDNEKAKVYLLLLLHTGLRDLDARKLEWRDVDLERGTILCRDTKNHTDFTAHIAPQIKPHIRRLQALTGDSRYCFPSETGGMMDTPRKPIQQVINQTGIEFSPHDLKRTFLTIGEAAGVSFSLLKALANHKTTNDVTGGYIHTEDRTRREATQKIAAYIANLTDPTDSNIISLRSAAP